MTSFSADAKPIYVATLHRPGDLIGGIQQHYTVFSTEARAQGYRVEILTPFHAPKVLWFLLFGMGKVLARINRPLHAWWYEYTRLKLLEYVLATHIPQGEACIIYAQDPVSAEAALSLKAQGYPVDIVGAVHFNLSTADEWVGKDYLEPDSRLYRRMLARDARVLPQLDRLIFVSQFMAQQVAKRLPQIDRVLQWLVPNFVPAVAPAETPVAAAQPGLDLITIGTLEPRKNQAFLLQVLYQTHQQGYQYCLSVVGDGPSRSKLQILAKTLGLEQYVVFLGARPDAAKLIGQHRVYVHAAQMESFGIVLAEALAAGKPLLAAAVGGIPEVFDDGVEGYYWPLEDAKAAASLLINVLEDPARYDAMASAARIRHANHFSNEIVQKNLLAAVLGEKPTA